MRIVTYQKLPVLDQIEKTGSYQIDKQFVETENFDETFKFAYDWIIKKMKLAGLEPPANCVYPIWGYLLEDYHKDDEYDDFVESLPEGQEMTKFLLDLSEDRILLSDYDGFHYVLNQQFLGNSEEEEFDTFSDNRDKIKSIFEAYIYRSEKPDYTIDSVIADIDSSWDKCLDISKPLWFHYGDTSKRTIQATFWTMDKCDIITAERLRSRGTQFIQKEK